MRQRGKAGHLAHMKAELGLPETGAAEVDCFGADVGADVSAVFVEKIDERCRQLPGAAAHVEDLRLRREAEIDEQPQFHEAEPLVLFFARRPHDGPADCAAKFQFEYQRR